MTDEKGMPPGPTRVVSAPGRNGSCLPPLQLGELVAERFRLLRFIARGGMGEVYEAEDTVLGTRVAVKVLRPEAFTDQVAAERLKRETSLARSVAHPNVCRVFDVFRHRHRDANGEVHELVGLTMELLEGETLADRLARTGPMPTEDALPIIRQMVSALAAAHALGVVHRDFKTSNVMLVPGRGAERVVVTDFGLAFETASGESETVTRLTDESLVTGTADYMAPEQVRGERITTACDIYALGVVLFEMVTGRRPFSGPTPMAVLLKRLDTDPPTPRTFRPDVPPGWERTILRCLARNPRHRPGGVGEVLGALEEGGVRSSTLVTSVLTLGDRLRFSLAGRGLRAPMLVLATLLVAAAGAWLLLGRDRAPAVRGAPVPTQLTSWPGLEVDACFSPDGHTLAFSSNRDGHFEIYTLQLAVGGEPRRLTDDGGQNFQPAWSPDGAWIAYASNGRGGIWVVPAMGGTPRPLTDTGSHPAWSPDGSRLVYQSDVTAELSANAVHAMPSSTLWVVDGDGGNARQITQAGQPEGGHGAPSWAPDGKSIVFAACDRRWSQVWALELGGGRLTRLIQDHTLAFDPLLDIDGHRLFYAAIGEGERYGVWSIPATGRNGESAARASLVANLGQAGLRQLALSPDGRRMALTALTTVSNLWALSLDERMLPAGAPRPLTIGTARYSRPAFSPDGSRIAFDHWMIGSNQDIWMMAVDGSGLRQLTLSTETDTQASWLPDGQIAFLSNRNGADALWSKDPTSGRDALLSALPPGSDSPRLSPDGRRVAFHSKGKDGVVNVWVADRDGANARQITFDDEFMGFACWSPDSRTLAFEVKRGEDDQVMVVPADGGTPDQLTAEPGKSWPYSFSPDGDKVIFAGLREGRWNLYWVSTTTRVIERLTEFDDVGGYVRYPAWSPDGRTIVFERAESAADLWLLDGLR